MNGYKLKIAQIAPIWYRIPPKEYGGTERVVSALTEELVRRGHDVTLFATEDSKTSAELFSIYPKGLNESGLNKNLLKANAIIMRHVGNAYKMQDKFDVIHDHLGFLNLPAANFSKKPVVVTLHGKITPDSRKLLETFDNPYYVSISKSQVKYFPNINIAGTVYNGLPMENYPFGESDRGYLLFVGRISKLKGVHLAIDIAKALNLPLIIAANLHNRDLPYFNKYIKPRLSKEIQWIGQVNEKERNRLMTGAICLLNPVTWKEPFGITMIEAMACGCPVVAFNRGSIPEVIKDGKVGFVVDDLGEMITAVRRIKDIDRTKCRNYAISNFSARRMADGYEEIYYRVVEERLHIRDLIRPFFNTSPN